mmetsp:Transcript_76953/g.152381  ORF Transcript_76953/g.152381 Transcript_76953/m.152381 type:complete len:184 (+) Transcript_76953:44-595(+)
MAATASATNMDPGGSTSPLAALGGNGKKVVTVSLNALRASLRPQTGEDGFEACKLEDDKTYENQTTWLPPPHFFMGCWVDSYGSTVVVQSTGESSMQLVATLSRGSKPDIALRMWCTKEGWFCGQAKLHTESGTSFEEGQISWIFPDGRRSNWTWQAFTLEALSTRGISLPQASFQVPWRQWR